MITTTLTRLGAYFTLICYFIVATLVVRFSLSESVQINVPTAYFSIPEKFEISSTEPDEKIQAPVIEFEKIKENPVKVVTTQQEKFAPAKRIGKKIVKKEGQKLRVAKIEKNELNFAESIKVEKVVINSDLQTNLISLYKGLDIEEKIASTEEKLQDEVKTTMSAAAASEDDIGFFDYSDNAQADQDKNEKLVENLNQDKSHPEIEVQNVSDLLGPSVTPGSDQALVPNSVAQSDYSQKQVESTVVSVSGQGANLAIATGLSKASESDSEFVAFDYSKAKDDIQGNTIPKVVKGHNQKQSGYSQFQAMSSHEKGQDKGQESHKNKNSNNQKVNDQSALVEQNENSENEGADSENVGFMPEDNQNVTLLIRTEGTNLKRKEEISGFELKFQDDQGEVFEDYGSGEIKFEANINQSATRRSALILKRGYVPTSTELILSPDFPNVTIPLIESETLNDLVSPYEKKGSVGSLLIELDNETEIAKVDVDFGQVITLDGNMQKTDKDDFRYQLFVGISSGNAMISYHRRNGEVVSKIVHIHEGELTFDANYYENIVDNKIRLYEENLLAKENTPLSIPEEQVKVFTSQKRSQKVNSHTYKMNFESSDLGGRRYVELNHLAEPVYVGLRDNNHLIVPSENFMRFILSSVEGGKLGNRCLVQVNLNKAAVNYAIGNESVGDSLMTYTQVLDNDGRFYHSLSEKSQKIIIVGEAQASGVNSLDAKINIKIEYQDGTSQFLNTYCSPNSYIVEQL